MFIPCSSPPLTISLSLASDTEITALMYHEDYRDKLLCPLSKSFDPSMYRQDAALQ